MIIMATVNYPPGRLSQGRLLDGPHPTVHLPRPLGRHKNVKMIIPLSGDNSKAAIHLGRWATSNDQRPKGEKYFNKYSQSFP